MNADQTATSKLVEIRKYPNRRYYQTGRSRHLTLEEIRSLIREGYDVRIIDSSSSREITAQVLTQIILDLDAPKLEMFPPSLLLEIIRVNDQLVKGFFERFFNQAFDSFLDFQKHFQTQWREGRIMPSLFPAAFPWTEGFFKSGPPGGAGAATHDGKKAEGEKQMTETLQELQVQVAALQRQLRSQKALRKKAGSGGGRASSSARGSRPI